MKAFLTLPQGSRVGAVLASFSLTLSAGVWAGEPLSALSPRGPMQPSDQLPILPSGGAQLQSITASAILGYVRNYPVGIYCDGVHDDTAALQAAINSGASFDLPAGICLTTATLAISTKASHGQTIRGAGATASDGGGTGKTTLRPLAAVTTAIAIDGAGFGGYLEGLAVENLSLDMSAMPAGSRGFSQAHAYDIHYAKVRVLNDSGKTSWNFGPGAYTTSLDDVQGALVYCLGNGSDNPTTITLINPDINGLNVEQCANVTTIGGAIQPAYTGRNTIVYLPPGNSPKGFGPNTSGMYLALGSYLLNAQFFSSLGTDWEALSQPPPTCASPGWSLGTYNDSTHGCHPIVLVAQIGGGVKNAVFASATFAGIYLYNLGGSADNLTISGYSSSGTLTNYHEGPETFDSSIWLNNSQAITGYSDDHSTQTLVIDASNGAASFKGGIWTKQAIVDGPVNAVSLYVTPSVSGTNFATIGQFGCYSGLVPSSSSCFMGAGSKFIGLQDPAGTISSFSLDANTGRITSGGGLCPGTGTDVLPNLSGGTCIVSGTGNPSAPLGYNGWYYLRSDCIHGSSNCIWHRESGVWVDVN